MIWRTTNKIYPKQFPFSISEFMYINFIPLKCSNKFVEKYVGRQYLDNTAQKPEA
jgi:hypothetical protein